MNTASCINALRRFFAVRGPAKQLRSDRGTNFIAASQELGMQPAKENQTSLLKYLHENGCTWEFNPPHASHMGGAWEANDRCNPQDSRRMLCRRNMLT